MNTDFLQSSYFMHTALIELTAIQNYNCE